LIRAAVRTLAHTAVIPLALTLGLALLSWLVITSFAGAEFAPATCLTTHCFCEMPRNGTAILQPANAWSSFAFVWIGGLIVMAGQRRDRRTAFPVVAHWIYGLAAIMVGVGSFFLHATLTLWGQFADVLGMYLLSGFSLVYSLACWLRWRQRRSMIAYVVVCALLVSILLVMPETRRWLFALVLVLTLAIEILFARPRRRNVQFRLLLIGTAAHAIAFGIWILDQTRAVCAPESLLQGHAVWHVLGALSVWMTYLYYRSERASLGGLT
jgi:hypothetical protein